jgi:hypothetical protein
MKKFLQTIFYSLFALISLAQMDSASLVPGIRAAADSMTTAFRNKDFITFAHFNNSRLVELLGGEAEFASFIEKQMESLKEVRFTEMKAGKIIRLVQYQGTYQCIIEQQSEIQMGEMVVSAITHLVGLSLDDGKSWRFADANTGTKEEFLSILPELNPAIRIPLKKQETGKTLVDLLKDYKTEYLP